MIVKKEEITAMDFNGLCIFDYTAKCKEKSSFAVIDVSPGVSHQVSWSKRSDKFYYVIDGTISFTINDEKYVLHNGDFCIIKKGEKFSYKNEGKEVVSLILVHTPNFDINEEVFE
jgi:mannose-6-phosphate isomerase-like protein (cupin superfamily)